MRHFLVILIVFLTQITVKTTAQTPRTLPYNYSFDSLVKVNEKYVKQDVRKLKLLNILALDYQRINPLKGIETGEKAILLAQKLNLSNTELMAEAYNNKGLNHVAKGEYPTAMELYEKALIINQSFENTYGIATNTLNIGVIYINKGDSKKAKELFEQALTLFESIKNKAGIAIAYSGLGNVYMSLSDYPKALEYLQKALTINEQIGNKNGMAANLYTIGGVYRKLSDNPKALEYYQKSLVINELLGNKRGIANNLTGIGNFYSFLSNYPKSLEYFQKALVIQEQIEDKSGISSVLGNIGIVYFSLSDYPKALEYYQKALNINEQMGNKSEILNNLGNIGNVYSSLSDYPKALEYYHKALTICEKIGNKSGMAAVLGSIAIVYNSLTDYPKALEYQQKALTIFEQIGNKSGIATTLGNIGSVYSSLTDYLKALEYYQKALAINEQIGDKFGIAHKLGNIGAVYFSLSDYPKALEYYQKALTLFEQIGNKSNIARNLRNIGSFYCDAPDSVLLKMGIDPAQRYEKSLEYQNKSLKIAQEIGAVGQQKAAWERLSYTYEKQGDYVKAHDAYKNYIVLRDSIESGEVKKKIEQKTMQYEFDKKETELKYEQQLINEKLIQSRQEASLSRQQLLLSNKEKDLQHLAFLKEKAEKQEKEKQLSLSEKEKQLQAAELQTMGKEKLLQQTELELSQAEVHRKKQQRNAFIVGMMLFLILSFFIYRNFIIQRKSNKIIEAGNRELKETQSQLVQQEKLASLGALTAGIAHEIKNPLNFVNNFAELSNELIDELDAATTQEEKNELLQLIKQNLSKINEHGKRADSIVKNMLAHSRTGTGEKLLTDINKLSEEFLNLAYHGMRANIKDFNCTIEKNLDTHLPKIKVVSQDISRVILNLINNAFYAIKDKPGAKVTLSTKALPHSVEISIKDNGTGMPESVREKIFEPFFTTKPSGSGTGLGLSLSFDIIKAHGGKIDVKSEVGKGTEFSINLPT